MRYNLYINKLTLGIFLTLLLFGFAVYKYLFFSFYNSPKLSKVLNTAYSSNCLSIDTSYKPVYECYEFEVEAERHTKVLIRHESGLVHKTIVFEDKGVTKIRFTPNLSGSWIVNNGPKVDINESRPDYAKGFVEAQDGKWFRSADHQPFIPQYIMYDKADIHNGIKIFVKEHGFTGFHITNLRDFIKNPEYFETIVLETYRAGGTTHFWLWGDKQRKLTPDYYDGDVKFLYQELLARLGPIPGWTVGYGFDLFEWATPDELTKWYEYWNTQTSYKHLQGARGYKNEYESIVDSLDYVSWEWHRPTLDDYQNHILQAKGKPAFSEDRFRIRKQYRHREKDYSEELTLTGLWDSFFSGGVANIWGKQNKKGIYSENYNNAKQIRFYRNMVDRYYDTDTKVFTSKDGIPCLKHKKDLLCFFKGVKIIDIKLDIENSFKTLFELYDLNKESVKSLVIDQLPYKTDKSSNWLLVVRRHEK